AGNVEFFDGSTDLGPGSPLSGSGNIVTSTFTLSSLAVGSHNIVAVYTSSNGLPNSNNQGTPLVQQITEATRTRVSSSGTPAAFGTQVTFTATVSDQDAGAGVPAGGVQFFLDDSATPINGSALSAGTDSATSTFTTNTLSLGNHSVVAVFTAKA